MNIIKRASDNVVLYAGPAVLLTLDRTVTQSGSADFDTTAGNAALEEVAELPADWIGGAYSHVEGVWAVVNASLLPLPPTPDEIAAVYENALMAMFDAKARDDRWDSRITCISRAGYPGPYQTRAQAFGTWMDTCAEQGYALLAAVKAGKEPMPTVEAFLASMPTFDWPTPLTGDE